MSVILEELGTVTQHNFYRDHSLLFFPYPNFRLLTSTTETHEPQSNSMRVTQADLRDHQWQSRVQRCVRRVYETTRTVLTYRIAHWKNKVAVHDTRMQEITALQVVYTSSHFWKVSKTGFFRRTMERGEPEELGDGSSFNWRAGVWGWATESGRRHAKSMYSPRSIRSSKVRSNGRVRPRGEADPTRDWRGGWAASQGRRGVLASEVIATCTDSVTVCWMAASCAGVKTPASTRPGWSPMISPKDEAASESEPVSSSGTGGGTSWCGKTAGDERLAWLRAERLRFWTRPEAVARGWPDEGVSAPDVAARNARMSCGREPEIGRFKACRRKRSTSVESCETASLEGGLEVDLRGRGMTWIRKRAEQRTLRRWYECAAPTARAVL